ncbi:hypothetical protein Csa_015604 [Cucumis sativus]|uniref:Uncharacterized protein n=1 Tax=Cucumis sativus TaxID=3659 RepID=A0A0A0K4F6_CUCSA|nr:hypothetical protein Csa_015604 [Cucumis sativus]
MFAPLKPFTTSAPSKYSTTSAPSKLFATSASPQTFATSVAQNPSATYWDRVRGKYLTTWQRAASQKVSPTDFYRCVCRRRLRCLDSFLRRCFCFRRRVCASEKS